MSYLHQIDPEKGFVADSASCLSVGWMGRNRGSGQKTDPSIDPESYFLFDPENWVLFALVVSEWIVEENHHQKVLERRFARDCLGFCYQPVRQDE